MTFAVLGRERPLTADDETYTYNTGINRLAAVHENNMVEQRSVLPDQ